MTVTSLTKPAPSRGGMMSPYHQMMMMMMINISLFSLITSIQAESLTTTETPVPIRYKDDLFSTSTLIMGRNVTCSSEADKDLKFAERTWSCYDIQVDGLKVRSYYFLSESSTSDGHCTDNTQGENDLPALCRHLLQAHHIEAPLSATLVSVLLSISRSTEKDLLINSKNTLKIKQIQKFTKKLTECVRVSDPVCTVVNETRIMMTKVQTDKSSDKEEYKWTEYKTSGKGFIRTLRCMVSGNPG